MSTQPWQGKLGLQFNWIQEPTCQTRQILTQVRSPLKVQRPFYPEGPTVCHTTLLHTAGGMVPGDQLSIDLHLQAHTQVLITTAAASKIYGPGKSIPSDPMQTLISETQQHIHIDIAEQAHLEWLPQETIIFAGAHYCQDLHIELALGATWLGWEIARLGRTARGEKFLWGNWRSRTHVWQNGKPLWIDPLWIPGNLDVWHSQNGLANQPIVATLVWLGWPVESALVKQIRSLWSDGSSQGVDSDPLGSSLDHQTEMSAAYPNDRQRSSRQCYGEAGVTRLMQGLLCRYRGNSSQQAKQWFMATWNLIRLAYRGRSAHPPRVWPL